MFNRNKKNLIGEVEKKTSVLDSFKDEKNPFVKTGFREQEKEKVSTTSLGNGALKYTTTGSDFVDQFASATNYKAPRKYEEVAKDMETLWSQNPETAMKFVLYLRMITRKPYLVDGSQLDTNIGQGLKHEGIMRMLWVGVNHPKAFFDNLILFATAGSWKDLFEMLRYDVQSNGWEGRKLNWNMIYDVINVGVSSEQTRDLVKKYLPAIRSRKVYKDSVRMQANTIIGKWLASKLFDGKTYKLYRKLKSSGEAHIWQQMISKGDFRNIDFNSIHGRALAQIAGSDFLKNHGLESKYLEWIEAQPVAKYTGYPYELVGSYKMNSRSTFTGSKVKEHTINKQFLGLVNKGKEALDENEESPFVVVMDSSASMTSKAIGTNVSAYGVAASMALYFSYLLKGEFKNVFFEFSDTTRMVKWKGETPLDRLGNFKGNYVGGTNFQSVADKFVKIKRQGVIEKDFPRGILCVTDGCFNSTSSNKTNTKDFLDKLRRGGFSEEFVSNFKIVLWDIHNRYYGSSQTSFEDFADTPNLFHISGLDPAGVAFIMGNKAKGKAAPKNNEELFEAAMNQSLLDLVTV